MAHRPAGDGRPPSRTTRTRARHGTANRAGARGWYGSQRTLQPQLLQAWWTLLRGDQAEALHRIAELPATATLGSPDMRMGVAGTAALAGYLDAVPGRETALVLRAAWERLGDAPTTPEIACMLVPLEVQLWPATDEHSAAEVAYQRRLLDLGGSGEQLAAEAGAGPVSSEALLQAVRLAASDRLVGLVDAFGPQAHTLRDLPTHRTVADIAELHSVSVNTIKSHLGGIYAKLSAQNRQEAVEEAGAQGLLSVEVRRSS